MSCCQDLAPLPGRVAGAALVPYHLGRAVTYILLAVLISLPLPLATRLSELRFVPAIALTAGAILFLILGFRGLRGSFGGETFSTMLGARVGRLTKPLLAKPWGWRGIGLGLMLGFLPCGLLYAAIGAAAATSDPLAAAMSMAVFTLGTFPMLWLVGYLGGWVQRRWARLARPAMPAIALLNAIVLGGMAWSWIAAGAGRWAIGNTVSGHRLANPKGLGTARIATRPASIHTFP